MTWSDEVHAKDATIILNEGAQWIFPDKFFEDLLERMDLAHSCALMKNERKSVYAVAVWPFTPDSSIEGTSMNLARVPEEFVDIVVHDALRYVLLVPI